MSEPSPSGPATTGPAKKPISPARNAIGLVVLVAVLTVGWFEYSAKSGYNAAVRALDTRAQDEEKDLMAIQEAESLFGKPPDGPGSDFQEGSLSFTKKTYTWRGPLKSYMLTAFYTKGADPRLHHYETEGAKYAPEQAAQVVPPNAGVAPDGSPPGPKGKRSSTTSKSNPEPAPDFSKPIPSPAAQVPKPAAEPAPEVSKPAAEPAPEVSKPAAEPAPVPAKTPK